MAEGFGGKPIALGGPKTTDRRFSGHGKHVGSVVHVKGQGGHKHRLAQGFLHGAGDHAHTAIKKASPPPEVKF